MKRFLRSVLPELFLACAVILLLWKAGEAWLGRTHPGNQGECVASVHFLDVGQGMATLVESGGKYMLVDGGGRDSAQRVLETLKENGVEELDYVVISHYDMDHLYGVVRVLEEYTVGQVLCPDYAADTETYRWLQDVIAARDMAVSHPDVGTEYTMGHCEFTVVSPVRMDYLDENNLSLGIRLVCDNVSFLMMGDAELESEYDVCDSVLPLRSMVYLVSHHGSSSSTSQQLLKTVRPKYAVISCGANNDYGHPAETVLERLRQFGVEIYRTDQQGSIIARTDGREISWEFK